MPRSVTHYNCISLIVFCLLLICKDADSQTWVKKNTGQYAGNITTMIFFNDTLYAGTQEDGIYASGDRGQSWIKADMGLPEESDIASFAIHNDTLFAGTYFDYMYIKTGGNKKWMPLNEIGLGDQQITSLLFQG